MTKGEMEDYFRSIHSSDISEEEKVQKLLDLGWKLLKGKAKCDCCGMTLKDLFIWYIEVTKDYYIISLIADRGYHGEFNEALGDEVVRKYSVSNRR